MKRPNDLQITPGWKQFFDALNSLRKWIIIGIEGGFCGSTRLYSAKSDKSKFGKKSIFAIF